MRLVHTPAKKDNLRRGIREKEAWNEKSRRRSRAGKPEKTPKKVILKKRIREKGITKKGIPGKKEVSRKRVSREKQSR